MVDDALPEELHEVEHKAVLPSIAAVQEADAGIEAAAGNADADLLLEHGIAKAQQAVHGILRRPAVPAVPFPGFPRQDVRKAIEITA